MGRWAGRRGVAAPRWPRRWPARRPGLPRAHHRRMAPLVLIGQAGGNHLGRAARKLTGKTPGGG